MLARKSLSRLGPSRLSGASRSRVKTKDLPEARGGLTGPDVKVLHLIVAGKTNGTITSELFLSEKPPPAT